MIGLMLMICDVVAEEFGFVAFSKPIRGCCCDACDRAFELMAAAEKDGMRMGPP